MFLLGRYEDELFEETYNAFPISRLYRVKFWGMDRIYRMDCLKLNRALTMDRITGWQDLKD